MRLKSIHKLTFPHLNGQCCEQFEFNFNTYKNEQIIGQYSLSAPATDTTGNYRLNKTTPIVSWFMYSLYIVQVICHKNITSQVEVSFITALLHEPCHISNHQPLDCFFVQQLVHINNKELHITTKCLTLLALCEGNPPVTGRSLPQRARNIKKHFQIMKSSFCSTWSV